MNTDEMTKFLDTLNEAFRKMEATVKELANSIREFVESLTSANERVYRLPDKYFYAPKKKYRNSNTRNLHKIERKFQRHLPYQRRIY